MDIPSIVGVIGYYDEGLRAPNDELAILEWEDNPYPRSVRALRRPRRLRRARPGRRRGRRSPAWRGATGACSCSSPSTCEVLQGDLPNGDAMRWARRNCEVTERDEIEITAPT